MSKRPYDHPGTRLTTVRLDQSAVDAIDEARGPLTRSDFIRGAVDLRLSRGHIAGCRSEGTATDYDCPKCAERADRRGPEIAAPYDDTPAPEVPATFTTRASELRAGVMVDVDGVPE